MCLRAAQKWHRAASRPPKQCCFLAPLLTQEFVREPSLSVEGAVSALCNALRAAGQQEGAAAGEQQAARLPQLPAHLPLLRALTALMPLVGSLKCSVGWSIGWDLWLASSCLCAWRMCRQAGRQAGSLAGSLPAQHGLPAMCAHNTYLLCTHRWGAGPWRWMRWRLPSYC